MWRGLLSVSIVAVLLGGCASIETFKEKHGFMPKHVKQIAVVKPVAPVVAPPVVAPTHTQKKRTIKWLFGNRAK